MAEDYLSCLPVEIIWLIFEYVLVVPYSSVHGECWNVHREGICILDGKTKVPIDTSLFMVDRRISTISRTIFYSQNRFILGGNCQKSLNWIQSQPQDLLLMIKRLDLLIRPAQFILQQQLQGWDELVASIPQYFELEALCLSIDACRVYSNFSGYDSCRKNDVLRQHPWMRPLFEKFFRPFLTHREKLGKLKDLFVLYPRYRSDECWLMEMLLEKTVKGKDYDSISRGKTDLAKATLEN